MRKYNALLRRKRLIVNLPGATIALTNHDKVGVVEAESARPIELGLTFWRRARIARWGSAPTPGASHVTASGHGSVAVDGNVSGVIATGSSIVVSNTGDAYATGAGSQATTGASFSGGSLRDEVDDVLKIAVPERTRVVIRAAGYTNFSSKMAEYVTDNR